MRSALWLPLLAAVVVVTACQEAKPPVRLDVIPTPNPAIADAIHRLRSGGFFFYEGLEWIEEAILRADVIARVSLQSTRTFVKEKDSRWFPVLEYRFQVHEYLKGSGPNEIGGLTYLWNKPSETEALAVAREMPTAHDTRWDNREAIVFLETDHRPYGYTTGIQIAADQHWFGLMIVGLGINAVSVSSIHSKRWLPEVAVATRGRASTDKLFLTDAPPTDPPPVGGGAARSAATSTLPTITLSTLKGRITELETEASAGGTDMYRACITGGYTRLRSMAHKAQERGVPRMRDSTVKSGLPAGTHADIPFHGAYSRTTSTPAIWKINGPDREIVRFVTVNWRPEGTVFKYDFQLVTTRPLPADTYAIYPNWRYKYCDKDLSAIENHTGITLTVTAHPRAVHDAFFDPVDIGAAVGADGTTTGALAPASFVLNGVTTAIESLKWDAGTVTMSLSPTASLADYAIDFIDVTGTTTLSLTSDNASTTALTWNVPDKPWADGDLLMLRIHKPISNDATLSGLALSGIDLAFDTATTTYAASVPATTTQTTVTPTTNHDSATYVVKLADVVDADGTIPLAAGDNVITIDVTAEDAVTTKTYSVTVTRATPSAPVTVTLIPRVDGLTFFDIDIQWSHSGSCDNYYVAIITDADYQISFLGFHPPETSSHYVEGSWLYNNVPDFWVVVECRTSGDSQEVGSASLRAAHPDNN